MFHLKDTKLQLFIDHRVRLINFYLNETEIRLPLLIKNSKKLVIFYDGLHKNHSNYKRLNKKNDKYLIVCYRLYSFSYDDFDSLKL